MSTKKRRPIKDLTPEELAEAKESLRCYFEIGWRIATCLQTENPEQFEAAVEEVRKFDLLSPKERKKRLMRKDQHPSSEKSSTCPTGVRKSRKVAKQKPLG